MPDFVQPPAISSWAIETCEDVCQTIPTFEGLIASINGFLTDWYNWLTSDSFPNVIYIASEDKFYYYDGQYKEFENFPNVLLNGVLRYRTGAGIGEVVPASGIEGNVFYLEGDTEYLRCFDGSVNGLPIVPFENCVRYKLSEFVLQFHNGAGWANLRIEPNQGSLLIDNGIIKSFQGSQYIQTNLPYRNGDLKEIGGFIWKYQDGAWSKFFWEGQVRATDDNTGLEVYRSGNWEHLHSF